MRTIYGLERGIEALCSQRGLNLDAVPAQVFDKTLTPVQFVERVLMRVREAGDEALRELTQRIDGVALDNLEVHADQVQRAYDDAPTDLIDALQFAAGRIRRYHEASMPESWMDSAEGYGESVHPVERVGAYVPGGTAPLISTALMTVIPAKVAGVGQVIVATPAGPDGWPDPGVLAAARVAGADRVFRIGGAQAIAAMAYGTETVPRVDIVCGPGGVFTTLAKKLVFGEVGVEGLYGPTETVVVADDEANPTLCAADLLAQAEHDVLATPVLITTSRRIAEEVKKEVGVRVERLDRAATASASMRENGCVVIVDNLDQALELANEFAPEHLCLMVSDPWSYVDQVRNAGVVFVGESSHEVLGDYVAGPSHVMPTGGTARFGSGLNVRSFLKFVPVVGLDDDTSAQLARHASVIARAEGLTGHAEAAEVREEIFTRER